MYYTPGEPSSCTSSRGYMYTASTAGTCSILRENLVPVLSLDDACIQLFSTTGTCSILRENLVPVLALEDTCIQLVQQVDVVYSERTYFQY